MVNHRRSNNNIMERVERTKFSVRSLLIRSLVLLLLLFVSGYTVINVGRGISSNKSIERQHKNNRTSSSSSSSLEVISSSSSSSSSTNSSSSIVVVGDIKTQTQTQIKNIQIENYRKDVGLMLNIHPTHHAGTTFCQLIGRNGINNSMSPSFACMGDKDNIMYNTTTTITNLNDIHNNTYHNEYGGDGKFPWSYNETNNNINSIRKYFSMISWEFDGKNINNTKNKLHILEDTNWDHPRLVSVTITRNPISRLLAGDGILSKLYPGYDDRPVSTLSYDDWWEYVTDETIPNTDNFFLRIVSGDKWMKNNKIQQELKEDTKSKKNRTESEIQQQQRPTLFLNQSSYEHAIKVLNRFTIVLDIECLNEGMMQLAKLLHLNTTKINDIVTADYKKRHQHDALDTTHPENENNNNNNNSTTTTAAAATATKNNILRERIGYEDVYNYLLEKNKWDILLYEYSKNISLVRCDGLI
jgi:hypothetical protein